MDFFQHRYYRLGKILMSLSGTWPYQRNCARLGIPVVVISIIAYQIVGEILAIVKYRNDWNILLECFIPIAVDGLCITKYLVMMCNSRKISSGTSIIIMAKASQSIDVMQTLQLLDRIRTDWQVCARHQDIKFLHEYAERGQKISIVCAAMMYFATFVYMIRPMVSKLSDVVLKNGTEPGEFPMPVVYYHLDGQKYYYYLIMYGLLCALILLTAFASSEVMLILYVQHVCAIFATVGYSNVIQATYTWNFFFNIVFGMIMLVASGLQILLRSSDLQEILTFIILSISVLICLYVQCGISQILIDHSISIRSHIYNSQWYRLPPKTQRILQLMTTRCNVPCQLTAGNILIMSMQSFGVTLQTAISYFAFMRSMQGL